MRRGAKVETIALALFGIAFLGFWVHFLNGGIFPPTPEEINPRQAAVQSQIWAIRNAVRELPFQVRASFVDIRIEDSDEHYGGNWRVSGDYHDDRDSPYFRTICVRSYASSNVVWHEAGHAYHCQLDRMGRNFSCRWESIGGGVLTPYGAGSIYEDVAEWMGELYLAIHGYPSAIDDFPRSEFLDPTSPYYQKLQLLREYGFITESHYRQVLN